MSRETTISIVWSIVMLALLAGCAFEGAGFVNKGRHSKPVVCREVRPGYTQCRSE